MTKPLRLFALGIMLALVSRNAPVAAATMLLPMTLEKYAPMRDKAELGNGTLGKGKGEDPQDLAARIGDPPVSGMADTLYLRSPARFGANGLSAWGQLRIKGGDNSARGTVVGGREYVSMGPVPEPEDWVMFLTGFVLVGIISRRGRRQAATT